MSMSHVHEHEQDPRAQTQPTGHAAEGGESTVPEGSSSGADLDLPSARACALASVPIPDRAGATERGYWWLKRKHRDRCVVDDDDEADGAGDSPNSDFPKHIYLGTGSDRSNHDYLRRVSTYSTGSAGNHSDADSVDDARNLYHVRFGVWNEDEDPEAYEDTNPRAYQLQSKWAKLGLISCVLATAIALVIGLGVSLKRNTNIPVAGIRSETGSQAEKYPFVGEPEEEMEDKHDNAYLRRRAEEAPPGDETEGEAAEEVPLGDEKEGEASEGPAKAKVKAAAKMAAEQVLEEAQLAQAYAANFVRFLPISYDRKGGWRGRTYLEAAAFCSKQKRGSEICPYKALCPLGPGNKSILGHAEGVDGGPMWAPISDDANDWVNISSENSCTRYSSEHGEKPAWGTTEEDGENIASNVVCCKGSFHGSAAEKFLYRAAAEKHDPVWYSRDDGWTGRTHDEGVRFCASRSATVCPYEAYCPLGHLDLPMGGARNGGPTQLWAPVSNAANGWVSVGPDDTCKPYSVLHGGGPGWGVSGAGSEDMTRHIMCCNAEDGVGSQEVQAIEVDESLPIASLPLNTFTPADQVYNAAQWNNGIAT